jgi:hypothetical protein
MEEDPEKFLEISRNLVRILDEKQVRLNGSAREQSSIQLPRLPYRTTGDGTSFEAYNMIGQRIESVML